MRDPADPHRYSANEVGSKVGSEVVGVVLAGGRSQRMGRDKALLPLLGEPLVARAVRRLRAVLPTVVVIGPRELAPVLPGVRLLPDQEAGLGPLGGLATAFAVLAARRIVLIACDMPFVVPELIGAMVAVAEREPWARAVVLRTARGVEPLHALYDAACVPVIEGQLARGARSLRGLLDRVAICEVGVEVVAALDPLGRSALNVNTPDEWERAVRLAREEQVPG
ncbi:MAG TPA: molybdenum cofactor guanylyltransferase [Ktedonobacterales bacterium]